MAETLCPLHPAPTNFSVGPHRETGTLTKLCMTAGAEGESYVYLSVD